jgi:hypothetical protein
MTMPREKLAVLTGAVAFAIGLLALTLWFTGSRDSESALDTHRTPSPSVANAGEELDRVQHARRKRATAADPADPVAQIAKPSGDDPNGHSQGEATLVVRVVDPPAGSQWSVSVDLAGARPGSPVRRSAPSTASEDARFEHVPVGPTVEVLAMESRGKQMPRRVRVEPPLVPGELREVRLAELVEAAVVFRVLDPSGAPCKEAWIDASVSHGSPNAVPDDMRSLHTDHEGHARLALEAPEGAAIARWLCVHAHGLPGTSTDETNDHFERAIPLVCELPRRDTNVGDVQLEPEPVVASGIVIAPSNESFRSITVGAVIAGRTNDDSIGLETHVDRDGRFEVRSALHGGMITLRAMPELFSRGEMLEGPIVTVPFGTRDIRLSVEVGGRISGSVIGADTKPATIEVRCKGGDIASGGTCWVGSGPFEFGSLHSGAYRVELRPSGELLSAVPLIAVEGVMVAAGAETKDSRLQSIDVTPLVRRLRIDLVDGEGQRVLEGACTFSRGGVVIGRREFSRARVDVAVGMAPVDVEIEAPGFEIARASDAKDGQRIMLQRGRLLRLKLASRDLLETLQSARLFAHLVPEGDAHGNSDLRGCLDEGGETTFTEVARGKWRIELELDVDCDAPGPHVRVRTEQARVVTVGVEPTIEVPIVVAEDAIAAARASLRDK